MVKKVRHQKNQPCLSYHQGLIICLSFAVLTLHLACTTQKSKTLVESKTPTIKAVQKNDAEVRIKNISLITDLGHSSQAVFSTSGNEVLFVSSGRGDHEQSQAYLFDFLNKKLTRITYSDGQVFRPFFVPPHNDSVIYSSSTDEDKEYPDLTRLTTEQPISQATIEEDLLLGKRFPGFEIYFRQIKNDSIRRLKRHAGYDMADDIDSSGKKLLVTSHSQNKTEISIIDINGDNSKVLNSYTGYYSPSPRFLNTSGVDNTPSSKYDRLVWISLNKDKTKNIVVSDKAQHAPRKIFGKNGEHVSLAVSPNGETVAFSSNFLDPNNFDIFIAKIDGSCVERVTTDKAEDLFPSFSPDGQKLLVTSKRSGHYQIYLLDLDLTVKPSCIL